MGGDSPASRKHVKTRTSSGVKLAGKVDTWESTARPFSLLLLATTSFKLGNYSLEHPDRKKASVVRHSSQESSCWDILSLFLALPFLAVFSLDDIKGECWNKWRGWRD